MVPELWRVVEGRVRTPRHDEVEGGRTGGVHQLTRRADTRHRAGYRQDGILQEKYYFFFYSIIFRFKDEIFFQIL